MNSNIIIVTPKWDVYCHACEKNIVVRGEKPTICPTCKGGFIYVEEFD